jgi:adenylate cyclase class 2
MSHPTPEMTSPAEDREIELRVYEIDAEKMRVLLVELGAVSLGTIMQERAVMDVVPVNPDKWIRVRKQGDDTTLAIKERISDTADGTGEVEIRVDDFDRTLKLLQSLNGYTPRSRQENRRELFDLDGAEVTIDTWPRIEPLLEIEATDVEAIYATADKLGIAREQLTALSVEQYYLDKLGLDVKTTPNLVLE